MTNEENPKPVPNNTHRMGIDHAREGSKDVTVGNKRKVSASGTPSQVVLNDEEAKSHEEVRRSQAQNSEKN